MSDLKPEHYIMVQEYMSQVKSKNATSYMLTIARDGENPERTIIFYDNAIDAAFAYNKYTDWGFAKKFLTVRLYEPSGKINEKILKRDQAGECTFVRKDYIDFENILFSYRDKIEKCTYDNLVCDIMTIFAKDNWRFDPERFLKALGVNRKIES